MSVTNKPFSLYGQGLLLIFAWVLAGTPAAWGEARLRLCNSGEMSLQYAVVREDSPVAPIVTRHVSEGWFTLEPEECHVYRRRGERLSMYLSVVGIHSDGRRVRDHGIQRIPHVRSTASWGVERFFCVRREQWERSTSNLSEHEQCPTGYYLQLYNTFVNVTLRSEFTLNIN